MSKGEDAEAGLSVWPSPLSSSLGGKQKNNYLWLTVRISVSQHKQSVWHTGSAYMCGFNHCCYLV